MRGIPSGWDSGPATPETEHADEYAAHWPTGQVAEDSQADWRPDKVKGKDVENVAESLTH